jgi:hypothetical protein
LPKASPYPGHYALVRSVVEGLRAIDADCNFNPTRLADIGRVVYAPANEALRQAADLKRRGAIDYLVAGPVNALFPDEADGILLMPEIDRLIVPSDWALEFFRDAPQLAAKSRVCPAGVDAEFWKPSEPRTANTAIVYWKSGEEAFCQQVERSIDASGLEPVRLRARPGEHVHFSADTYRRLLGNARLGVFLSAFETQGLALAEAWSMNVPTLVWDPREETEWRGRRFPSRSSAPYLTPATGRTWQRLDQLEPMLRAALADPSAFRPREWVLAHMTDARCAAALYDIIRDGWAEARRSR